jgi:thiamine transport system permease protein
MSGQHRDRSRASRPIRRPLERSAVIGGLFAVLVLSLLFLYPLIRIGTTGFHWSAISEILHDKRTLGIAWFSLWQATLSTCAVLAVAIPTAATVVLLTGRIRRFVLGLLIAPFTLPTVVVVTAMRQVLPHQFSTGVLAIICAHIFYNAGMATLIIVPRWQQLDRSLGEAASTLGATPIRRATTVTLPILGPAIRNAALLVFTLSFTSFGVVLMLGGNHRATIDVEIYRQALQRLRFDRASILAAAQLVALGFLAYLANRAKTHEGNIQTTDTSDSQPLTTRTLGLRRLRRLPRLHRLPRPRLRFRNAALAMLLSVMFLPLAALLRRSLHEPKGSFGFANFRALLRETKGSGISGTPLSSFPVSLRAAIIAASLALLLGVALSVAATESRLATSFRLFGALPLATSSVQLGLGFLLAFASAPLAWRSRWFAIPLVQAVVAVPFVIRQIGPVFDGIAHDLRNAAMTLGSSPWRAWRAIDLRIARPAIQSAFALAFAISLGEFGAATLLPRPKVPTVPIAIARLSSRPGSVVQGQAAALAVLLGVLTISLVVVAFSRSAPNSQSSRVKIARYS